MASRFWVGGTGTWDSSTTTHWASSSNGTGGASVPGASDTVTFDANSGGGTVTVNFGGTITVQSITMGAFTGTLDFSANNNSVTLSASTGLNCSGTGTRTLNMGSGTWTFSANAAQLNFSTVTNLTLSAASATLSFTGSGLGTKTFSLGAGGVSISAFGTVSVAANSSGGVFSLGNLGQSTTITTFSVSAPNYIVVPTGITLTITNALSVSGSSGSEVAFVSGSTATQTTVSSANNGTFTWCAFRDMGFSGGGTFTATSSFNLGNNSGITITAPASGGMFNRVDMVGGMRG
jgi:hypothetical protein